MCVQVIILTYNNYYFIKMLCSIQCFSVKKKHAAPGYDAWMLNGYMAKNRKLLLQCLA